MRAIPMLVAPMVGLPSLGLLPPVGLLWLLWTSLGLVWPPVGLVWPPVVKQHRKLWRPLR